MEDDNRTFWLSGMSMIHMKFLRRHCTLDMIHTGSNSRVTENMMEGWLIVEQSLMHDRRLLVQRCVGCSLLHVFGRVSAAESLAVGVLEETPLNIA